MNESGLADALDLALAAHGSASAVVDDEVASLVDFARAFAEAASQVKPSDEFRARSRRHLIMHMARSARQQRLQRPSVVDRARMWATRFAAGLAALTLAGAGAASASASALPGDALYPVKQVTEAASLQLAPTDGVRQEILLHQADTRLDETARLLQQGRDGDAATAASEYELTMAALPTTGGAEGVQRELAAHDARLAELLQTAPARARPGLERALSATERHLQPIAQHEPEDAAVTSADPKEGSNRSEPTPVTVAPEDQQENHAASHADAPPPMSSSGHATPRGNAQPPPAGHPRPGAEQSAAAPRAAPPGHGRP